MIYINDKAYDFVENNTIYEFIRNNNIFLPYFNEEKYNEIKYDISYVEVKGYEQIINSKEQELIDGMEIYTNSTMVHTYLYNLVKEKKDELKKQCHQTISLNKNDYNILLCQPECYDICLEKYKDKGFNDIISTKLGHMIASTEICQSILELAKKKYDKEAYDPMVIMIQSIIDLPSRYQYNIKPAGEIMAQLIKNFFKEKLHINKNINIIYVTKSVICLITQETRKLQYETYIDNIVEVNHFDVVSSDNCYDGLFSKTLYKQDTTNLNVSLNYNVFFKILNQMGFKEESIEISTTSYGKEVIANYEGMEISCLFTDHFLTTEEIDNLEYDVIIITTRKQTMYVNSDDGYLADYNLNQIYRKLLVKPGYSNICRR